MENYDLVDLMTDSATIYGRGVTGRADSVLLASLPCYLSTAHFRNVAGAARAELASVRTLYWLQDYDIPPDAQIQINGDSRRFNLRQETQRLLSLPDDSLHYHTADLIGSARTPSPTTT